MLKFIRRLTCSHRQLGPSLSPSRGRAINWKCPRCGRKWRKPMGVRAEFVDGRLTWR